METSVDIKSDILNKFYKEFKKLEGIRSTTKETKQTKITVPKMHNCLMMRRLETIKKNITRIFKATIECGG